MSVANKYEDNLKGKEGHVHHLDDHWAKGKAGIESKKQKTLMDENEDLESFADEEDTVKTDAYEIKQDQIGQPIEYSRLDDPTFK
jgi:hypothetical protein